MRPCFAAASTQIIIIKRIVPVADFNDRVPVNICTAFVDADVAHTSKTLVDGIVDGSIVGVACDAGGVCVCV